MGRLNLTWEQYGLLSVRQRTIYVIRDYLQEWFQSLSDNAQMKELTANAKRNESRKTPAITHRP